MTAAAVTPAIRRLVDYLAELGPRWGLPAEPCRIHGYLYLVGRPAAETELGEVLGLDDATVADALAWLADYRLVGRTAAGWRTESDPWELMLRALEERRRREVAPALDLLRECRRAAQTEGSRGGAVAKQVGKLVALVEDLAAIDMQARRLSPQTLRQLIGFGGRAARFIDRAFKAGER